MKRPFGVLLALTMLAAACSSGGATQPSVSSTETSSAPVSTPPLEPILATWRSEYTCEKFVRAFEKAGISELTPQWLVNFGIPEGPADRLRGITNMCEGATRFQRTHIFRPNGYLLNYQDKKLVDDCRCYMLVGDRTFVSLGDPGDPDVTLHYVIDGDILTFDVVMPDQCTTATCLDAVAFSVGQYALGPWQRVP